MNIAVFSDLHGNWQGLLNTLRSIGAIDFEGDDFYWATEPELAPPVHTIKRNDDWHLIQLGDAAHMGSHTFKLADRGFKYPSNYAWRDDLICLTYCERFFNEILVGNHEIYFTHNLDVGIFGGMAKTLDDVQPGVMEIINTILGRAKSNYGHAPRFTAATTVTVAREPWLITHAGLHPYFNEEILRDFMTDADEFPYEVIVDTLNDNLIQRASHMEGYIPWIDDVGPASSRMTDKPWSGIFWLRPNECDQKYYNQSKFAQINQIIGHTPNRDHPRYVSARSTWQIDNGDVACLVSWNDQPWKPITNPYL